MKTFFLLPVAFFLASFAAAQTPTPALPACNARDAELPADLAAWRTPMAAGASLSAGHAVAVALRPAAEVQTTVPPHSPQGGGTTMVARLGLEVANPGTYAIAVDGPVWIDLVRDGPPLRPTAHARGPVCSTIHRILDFQLAPGSYTIQLSGTSASSARLLVVQR